MAKPTIGIIGAGHIGSQVARLAISCGYPVVIGNSRGPDTLAELVAELGPSARAATAEDAAKTGEIVVVSIPLKNYRDVPVAPLAARSRSTPTTTTHSVTATSLNSTTSQRRPPSSCKRSSRPRRWSRRSTISMLRS